LSLTTDIALRPGRSTFADGIGVGRAGNDQRFDAIGDQRSNRLELERRVAQRADHDRIQMPLARKLLEGLRHAAEEAIVVKRNDHPDQAGTAGAQAAGLAIDAEGVFGSECHHALRSLLRNAPLAPVSAEHGTDGGRRNVRQPGQVVDRRFAVSHWRAA
jgi:hypothetical protein